MAQHTVDLPCILDTWIDKQNPTANNGSSSYLQGRIYQNGTYLSLMLLQFDKSLIPAGKIISSVKLRFCPASAYSGGDIFINVLSQSWTESVNWNTGSFALTGGFNKIATGSYSSGIYYEIPISKWYVTSSNYGISLYSDNGSDEALRIYSRHTANPPMLRVTYEDVPPNAPIPLDPIGDYKDNKSVIRFSWQYNSDVGGTQKAFDLQWSTDQANWTTVSLTTANNYYDMPADTLPAGNIYWRVRCYNEYDEVGPYCDIQSFYAIGAPAAPVINAIPTNTARPLVTWSAFDQQIYQLQVLQDDEVIYDSGEQPGINIRQYKIKAWLDDGEYTVKVRIKNEYDLWSDWASATFEIATAKPTKPSVNLQRAAYGIELHIEDIADYALIFRADYDTDDYICIGKTTSATYVDNSVRNKGEYKYFIRSVSADETFEDSDIKFAQAELRQALIAPVSDLTNVFAFTRSLNAPPKRIYNRQPGGAFVEYAGRKHPVWEPTEHVNAAWQMSFYLKAWAEVEAFIVLVDRKETVLYRDAKGRKIYGVLGNLSVSDERIGYTVSFTLTEVDYSEGVEV